LNLDTVFSKHSSFSSLVHLSNNNGILQGINSLVSGGKFLPQRFY
jgi:hypothetical protein